MRGPGPPFVVICPHVRTEQHDTSLARRSSGAGFGRTLFGAVSPLSKILLDTVNPFMLAGLMYLGAGLGLAAYRGLRGAFGASTDEAQLRRGDIPWLAVAIGMGGVVGPSLLIVWPFAHFGVQRRTAAQHGRLGDHGDRLGRLS